MTRIEFGAPPETRKRLASLHCVCLSDSLVASLGVAAAERYYAFLDDSVLETVIRIENGGSVGSIHILGACVISYDPATLMRRFAKKHGFATAVLVMRNLYGSPRLRAFCLGAVRRSSRPSAVGTLSYTDLSPELLQVYVDNSARSHGIGAELMSAADRYIAGAGYARYFLKTEASTKNRALAFYRRIGWSELGSIDESGKRYTFFKKDL